ncbi:MAG: zf-TFIIB domain-containing protein [Fimbriimonadales bacterium]|nr:zf-TFIIB domain-containing protein [Fimbriimonadales bacterium]
MKCPVCNIELQMAVRSGIEIDYCPNCRGVWLDRGELDKIIERHVQEMQGMARSAPPTYAPEPPPYRPAPHPKPYYEDDDYHHAPHHPKRRKKRDWFEELFDIFD